MFSNREQFQAFSKMQHDWDDRGELDCLGQKTAGMTKMTYLAGLQHFQDFNNIYKLQDLCDFDHQTDISVFHNFEFTEIKLLDFECKCGLALEL